jgi:hypothetical protein
MGGRSSIQKPAGGQHETAESLPAGIAGVFKKAPAFMVAQSFRASIFKFY